MKNVAVLTEDGAFALFFRPHPGGFDSSRVPIPGNWLMHNSRYQPHSTKNKIKLAPQWTPNIKGYYGKKEKANLRRDAAHGLTISIVTKYMYL